MIKENMVNGLPANLDFNSVPLNCVHCIAGKSTRQPFNWKPTITHEDDVCNAMSVGDEIVSDTFGPIEPLSRNGNRFILEFIDVASRFAFMFAIMSLDLVSSKYKVFQNLFTTQKGLKIKMLHTDGHGSYTNHEMQATLANDGTLHKIRSPYVPEQNAIAHIIFMSNCWFPIEWLSCRLPSNAMNTI